MRSMWNCMIWGRRADAHPGHTRTHTHTHTHTHTQDWTNRCMYSMCCFPRAYLMRNSMRRRKNLLHFDIFFKKNSAFFRKIRLYLTHVEYFLGTSNVANIKCYLIQSMMMIASEIHVIPFPLNLSMCLCVFILHSLETEERYISFGISSQQRKN